MSRTLRSSVVLIESVILPNDKPAVIRIHHDEGGYGGVLVLPNGNELALSHVGPKPQTAAEAMHGAKKFLASVYGSRN
jgi:hypothetical protein